MKRFDMVNTEFGYEMKESPLGDFVEYEDMLHLIEALQKMVNDYEEHVQFPVKTFMQAKAAINKAKGEL